MKIFSSNEKKDIKPQYYWIGAAVVFILVISSILWSRSIHKASEDSINDLGRVYLQEISNRNVDAIKADLRRRLEIVETAMAKVKATDLENEDSITNYLDFVISISGLDLMCFVDQNGNIYTKRGIITKNPPELDFIREEVTEPKISTLVDFESKSYVFLGMPFTSPENSKIKMVSCFSGVSVDKLIESENHEESTSQSFCEIYRFTGNPILETQKNPLKGTNLFDYYKKHAVFQKGYSLEKVQRQWLSKQSGYTAYKLSGFGKTYMYFSPILTTDWMIATYMRETDINKVVRKNSKRVTSYSLVMVGIVIILMLVLFFIIYMVIKSERKSQMQIEVERSANKAKTTFLFNMSHDIRTPMNAIIGYTDLIEKNCDDKKKVLDYLKKIRLSSDVLLSLINNVLEIARIESGNEKLNETNWSLEEFQETIGSIFDSQMADKNIQFIKNVKVQHKIVCCDSTKVREIFLNILSNAYKYTPFGGTITMDVQEVECGNEGYAAFRTVIRDTGAGMSKDFIPHIFEEFSRERSSTESKVVGTGLGMQIVKKYLDLMGGSINIDSEIGQGTTITIGLMHKIVEQEELPQSETVTETKEVDFTGYRVLLAEDNDLNAEIAITILEELGFIVDRASDGLMCLNFILKEDAHYYDLILMDIQMPNMNGYDATKSIRNLSDKNKTSIPIIAMTANAFEEDKNEALQAGMDGHVAKPIDINELKQSLSKVLSV